MTFVVIRVARPGTTECHCCLGLRFAQRLFVFFVFISVVGGRFYGKVHPDAVRTRGNQYGRKALPGSASYPPHFVDDRLFGWLSKPFRLPCSWPGRPKADKAP